MLSGLIVVLGYLPWLPFLNAQAERTSFWIAPIPTTFMGDFFFEYFGNSDLLKPVLLLLLIVFILRASLSGDENGIYKINHNPLVLSLTIILCWVFTTYFLPYWRSLLSVPMLFPRYTIVLLPAILLALAYGIELFKSQLLKYAITSIIVLLSLTDIVAIKSFYHVVQKTQFREMTQFVVEHNTENYPIINEVTEWQEAYYLRKYDSKAEVLSGKKADVVDSILQKSSPKYEVEGFWIIGAHGDKYLEQEKFDALSKEYELTQNGSFKDAWAQLYISKYASREGHLILKPGNFDENGPVTLYPNENQIALWSGKASTKPFLLKKGKYAITLSAKGTSAKNEFPHIIVSINQQVIGDYSVGGSFDKKSFSYQHNEDQEVVITIEMDNDLAIEGDGDRNLFLEPIVLDLVTE